MYICVCAFCVCFGCGVCAVGVECVLCVRSCDVCVCVSECVRVSVVCVYKVIVFVHLLVQCVMLLVVLCRPYVMAEMNSLIYLVFPK